jgi:hypothetical protein
MPVAMKSLSVMGIEINRIPFGYAHRTAKGPAMQDSGSCDKHRAAELFEGSDNCRRVQGIPAGGNKLQL